MEICGWWKLETPMKMPIFWGWAGWGIFKREARSLFVWVQPSTLQQSFPNKFRQRLYGLHSRLLNQSHLSLCESHR
jgi:hypothetical protein